MNKYFILFLFFAACGYYSQPIAPEYFAPQEVEKFAYLAKDDAILFRWEAPSVDRKDDKLKYIDGYLVKRRGPVNSFAELKDAEFKTVATVQDIHLLKRKELRDEAIKEGKVSRKVYEPEELTKFLYQDNDVEQGLYYAYQVTPYNDYASGVDSPEVQVYFDGVRSSFYSLSKGLAKIKESKSDSDSECETGDCLPSEGSE